MRKDGIEMMFGRQRQKAALKKEESSVSVKEEDEMKPKLEVKDELEVSNIPDDRSSSQKGVKREIVKDEHVKDEIEFDGPLNEVKPSPSTSKLSQSSSSTSITPKSPTTPTSPSSPSSPRVRPFLSFICK